MKVLIHKNSGALALLHFEMFSYLQIGIDKYIIEWGWTDFELLGEL